MSQIAFVTDQHNNNVAVGMITQFLQPAGDVFVGSMLAGEGLVKQKKKIVCPPLFRFRTFAMSYTSKAPTAPR